MCPNGLGDHKHLFLKKFIYYLFLAVLGLRFCARAFSSCGKGGHSSSRCAGLSLSRPLLLWSTGSRRAGSVVVAHRSSCSTACGILPDQGSNPCPLHWQADSQPLRHQGSPINFLRCFCKHYLTFQQVYWLVDIVSKFPFPRYPISTLL